jgi:two-component system sensor histidine kinase DegS
MLKKVQSMSVSILDNINKLIYRLRPALLDDLGLLAGIRWLGENVLSPAGVTLKLTTHGRRRRLQREVETALFRVAQEAFNNVDRHARATRVEVIFEFTPELLSIDISDDGAGFDIEDALHVTGTPRGLGLLGMTERIELIGGRITFHSNPGEGTRIHIEVPRSKEAHNGKDKDTHSR